MALAQMETMCIMSQWSLTFEVRKSCATRTRMGRAKILSQWSLTFEVRKRAASVPVRARAGGRNGA